MYEIRPGKTVLGRAPTNPISLADPMASRHHCEIEYTPENNSLVLRDLGSKNGTFHNGKLLKAPRNLEADDQIRIGQRVFELQFQAEGPVPDENVSQLHTRPLTDELVRHSIDRHTILLNEIAEYLNDASDLDSAFDYIANLTKKVLGADKCLIVPVEKFNQIRPLGIPRSIARQAIEDKLVVLIRDTTDQKDLGKTGLLQGVHSALCVPVLVREQVSAIFYMDRTTLSVSFSELELQLAVGISHQLALAIHRQLLEYKMLEGANHDPLTRLPNQTLLNNLLDQAMKKARENPESSFALFTLDLDEFSTVNDSYGYTFGDELLQNLSRNLSEILGPQDILARLYGDEFALLITGIKSEEEAIKLANQLHQKISKPFRLKGRQINLSASIGIGLSTLNRDRSVDLLRDAETAMHRAREKGKGGTAIFDTQMRDRSIARLNLESKLSKALENKEFFVKYQPIVSLTEETVHGFEALVRWQQNHDLEVVAGDFIPLAEQTQYIFEIDRLVMQDASIQFAKWRQQYHLERPLWVSVNVSSRHMAHKGLVVNLKHILDETKLDPACLVLEFTEKSLIENDNQTIVVLNQLKEMGVKLSIDDFGTGYSSLSYLRHFPVDYLKLDRSFIIEKDWEIAGLVADLAHKLHLGVIAEGVETREQLYALRDLSCDLAQGNLFAADLYAQEAGEVLDTGKLVFPKA